MIKFNFSQLNDLSEDLKKSPRAVSAIVQKVLSQQLRQLRREMAPLVPRGITGRLRRSFGVSVRRRANTGTILATFGFMSGRRVTANAAIAANVLQRGSATARKGAYLWIPTRQNTNISPRDFFNADDTFIRTGKSGSKIAFVRSGNTAIPLFVLKHTVRLGAPPLPIDQRVEAQLPTISEEIQETIKQVIEARKAVEQVL